MADDKIQLTVQINSETGSLEVVGKKLEEVGASAQKAEGGFAGLSKEAGGLLKTFLPFATLTGVVGFFTAAVKGAEEENEALRRMGFTLQSLGVTWDQNRDKVVSWASAIQEATRFSDTQALNTLDKFIRVTGSLTQAQSASILAMNMSVASGKRLEETEAIVTDLLNGKQRALLAVNKEFGAFAGGATTAQSALVNLQKNLQDVAVNEDSLTKKASLFKNAWQDLSDTVGNVFTPVVAKLFDVLRGGVSWIDKIGSGLAGAAFVGITAFTSLTEVINKALSFRYSLAEIKEEAAKALEEIGNAVSASAQQMEQAEAKKTQISIKGHQERLAVTAAFNSEESQKFSEMELELEQKIAALGQQTLAKKTAAFEAEVKARQNKINKEIQDESKKQALLGKLNEFEMKGKAELLRDESILRAQAAINVMQTAVQTLQVVNSLGEQGSASERARAKALLALQQALAIGWAWVSAQKAGPFGHALAVAETALIIANFATQSKNIDRASSQEQADISGISINPSAPGVDLGVGTPPSGGGISTGSFSPSGGGGGGGGGAGNVINVGGIVVNFDVDRLSTDNVDAVMTAMYVRLRQATIEGVQLAIQLKSLADKNPTLAA